MSSDWPLASPLICASCTDMAPEADFGGTSRAGETSHVVLTGGLSCQAHGIPYWQPIGVLIDVQMHLI